MDYLAIARQVIAEQRRRPAFIPDLDSPRSIKENAEASAGPCAEPEQRDIENPDLDDYLFLFYERAAICEHDGGMSRTDSEREALCEVLATFDKRSVR